MHNIFFEKIGIGFPALIILFKDNIDKIELSVQHMTYKGFSVLFDDENNIIKFLSNNTKDIFKINYDYDDYDYDEYINFYLFACVLLFLLVVLVVIVIIFVIFKAFFYIKKKIQYEKISNTTNIDTENNEKSKLK